MVIVCARPVADVILVIPTPIELSMLYSSKVSLVILFLGSLTTTSPIISLLAKHCDLEAGEFVHFIGNAHIYDDHITPLKLQLENEPYEFPELEIKEKRENIDDYTFDDFKVGDQVKHSICSVCSLEFL